MQVGCHSSSIRNLFRSLQPLYILCELGHEYVLNLQNWPVVLPISVYSMALSLDSKSSKRTRLFYCTQPTYIYMHPVITLAWLCRLKAAVGKKSPTDNLATIEQLFSLCRASLACCCQPQRQVVRLLTSRMSAKLLSHCHGLSIFPQAGEVRPVCSKIG